MHGSGTTILIISNEKMNDIMKIFKLLKILKGSLKQLKTIKKGGFLSMLLGTLGASLLRNLLEGKGI